ncbi:MAG: hypothetical protein Kow0090_10250 [Myxococcota bacterium]
MNPQEAVTKKWTVNRHCDAVRLSHFLYSGGAAGIAAMLGFLSFGAAFFLGVLSGSLTALFTLAYWSYLLLRLLRKRISKAYALTIHFLVKMGSVAAFMYFALVVLGVSGVGFMLGFLIILSLFSFFIMRSGASERDKKVLSRYEWEREI